MPANNNDSNLPKRLLVSNTKSTTSDFEDNDSTFSLTSKTPKVSTSSKSQSDQRIDNMSSDQPLLNRPTHSNNKPASTINPSRNNFPVNLRNPNPRPININNKMDSKITSIIGKVSLKTELDERKINFGQTPASKDRSRERILTNINIRTQKLIHNVETKNPLPNHTTQSLPNEGDVVTYLPQKRLQSETATLPALKKQNIHRGRNRAGRHKQPNNRQKLQRKSKKNIVPTTRNNVNQNSARVSNTSSKPNLHIPGLNLGKIGGNFRQIGFRVIKHKTNNPSSATISEQKMVKTITNSQIKNNQQKLRNVGRNRSRKPQSKLTKVGNLREFANANSPTNIPTPNLSSIGGNFRQIGFRIIKHGVNKKSSQKVAKVNEEISTSFATPQNVPVIGRASLDISKNNRKISDISSSFSLPDKQYRTSDEELETLVTKRKNSGNPTSVKKIKVQSVTLATPNIISSTNSHLHTISETRNVHSPNFQIPGFSPGIISQNGKSSLGGISKIKSVKNHRTIPSYLPTKNITPKRLPLRQNIDQISPKRLILGKPVTQITTPRIHPPRNLPKNSKQIPQKIERISSRGQRRRNQNIQISKKTSDFPRTLISKNNGNGRSTVIPEVKVKSFRKVINNQSHGLSPSRGHEVRTTEDLEILLDEDLDAATASLLAGIQPPRRIRNKKESIHLDNTLDIVNINSTILTALDNTARELERFSEIKLKLEPIENFVKRKPPSARRISPNRSNVGQINAVPNNGEFILPKVSTTRTNTKHPITKVTPRTRTTRNKRPNTIPTTSRPVNKNRGSIKFQPSQYNLSWLNSNQQTQINRHVNAVNKINTGKISPNSHLGTSAKLVTENKTLTEKSPIKNKPLRVNSENVNQIKTTTTNINRGQKLLTQNTKSTKHETTTIISRRRARNNHVRVRANPVTSSNWTEIESVFTSPKGQSPIQKNKGIREKQILKILQKTDVSNLKEDQLKELTVDKFKFPPEKNVSQSPTAKNEIVEHLNELHIKQLGNNANINNNKIKNINLENIDQEISNIPGDLINLFTSITSDQRTISKKSETILHSMSTTAKPIVISKRGNGRGKKRVRVNRRRFIESKISSDAANESEKSKMFRTGNSDINEALMNSTLDDTNIYGNVTDLSEDLTPKASIKGLNSRQNGSVGVKSSDSSNKRRQFVSVRRKVTPVISNSETQYSDPTPKRIVISVLNNSRRRSPTNNIRARPQRRQSLPHLKTNFTMQENIDLKEGKKVLTNSQIISLKSNIQVNPRRYSVRSNYNTTPRPVTSKREIENFNLNSTKNTMHIILDSDSSKVGPSNKIRRTKYIRRLKTANKSTDDRSLNKDEEFQNENDSLFDLTVLGEDIPIFKSKKGAFSFIHNITEMENVANTSYINSNKSNRKLVQNLFTPYSSERKKSSNRGFEEEAIALKIRNDPKAFPESSIIIGEAKINKTRPIPNEAHKITETIHTGTSLPKMDINFANLFSKSPNYPTTEVIKYLPSKVIDQHAKYRADGDEIQSISESQNSRRTSIRRRLINGIRKKDSVDEIRSDSSEMVEVDNRPEKRIESSNKHVPTFDPKDISKNYRLVGKRVLNRRLIKKVKLNIGDTPDKRLKEVVKTLRSGSSNATLKSNDLNIPGLEQGINLRVVGTSVQKSVSTSSSSARKENSRSYSPPVLRNLPHHNRGSFESESDLVGSHGEESRIVRTKIIRRKLNKK